MNDVFLRIIGDVHGKMTPYVRLAQEAEYSIQLGDLAFDYSRLKELNPERHRVLGGNHDCYEEDAKGNFVWQPSHFLGDFGVHTVPGFGDFFYVRGGFSVDKEYRDEGVDWWPREQISYAQGMEALKLYTEVKPDFVLTHECPVCIIDLVSGGKTWNGRPIRPSMTANLLQSMMDVHKPKGAWLFGHHHKDFYMSIEGVPFRCLAELSYVDLNRKGE